MEQRKHFLWNESRLYPSSGRKGRIYALLDWKWFPICMFLTYSMLPFLVYGDYFAAGRVLFNGDGIGTFYQFNYLRTSLLQGELPLWTPYLSGGMPYGDGATIGVFYPINWLCVLLPPLTWSYVCYGLHLAIGGTFLYLYLRKIDCDALVSAAVSLIYLFSVHMGGARKEHFSLQVTALWVPVILFFLERYLRDRRLKYLFWASGAMALQFIGGFLQYAVYSDIFVFFYLLFSGIHREFKIKTMLLHGTTWLLAYFGFIMIGVIPLAKLMLYLRSGDGVAMPIELFSIASLHPVKLLMVVFPKLFGADVWTSMLNQNCSSGMDAELIMGAPCIALLFTGLKRVRDNFYARYAVLGGLGTLLYACLGQSEILKQLFYRIPVLNQFRLPSRTLFLFTLCCMILLATTMSDLLCGKLRLQSLHWANLLVGIGMTTVFLWYVVSGGHIWDGAESLPLQEVFLTPFILYAAYLLCVYGGLWLKRGGKIAKSWLRKGFSAVIALLFILQVWPYYRFSYVCPYEVLTAYPEELIENQGEGKVWDPDGVLGLIRCNQAIFAQIPTLNAYMNFYLPNLYKFYYHTLEVPMNASGLYVYFSGAEQALKENNGLLSMLDVNRIILPPDATVEQPVDLYDYTVESTLITANTAEFSSAPDYQYMAWPVPLEENSLYHVAVTVEAGQEGDRFYVDFADAGYDFQEQEKWFTVRQGKQEYQAFLPSGNSDVADNILFRIIALTNQPLSVSNVRVEKVKLADTTPVYRRIAKAANYSVYENLNARGLFYPAEKVIALSETERDDLYLNTKDYDILHTSYLTNGETNYDYSDANVQVMNIQLHNNQANALVETDKDTFINMSQVYYPGWNVYIDGVKTQLYEVNGIIQGTFVPAGIHTVEFRYEPASFYVGTALSAATILLCVIAAIWDDRKKRSNE